MPRPDTPSAPSLAPYPTPAELSALPTYREALNPPPPDSHWLTFRPSGIHGWGAFAKQRIPPNIRVIEYVGEKIDKQESLRRCESNNEYIFSLDEHHDLDGNVPQNPARLINHSCAPNCEAQLDGDRIWIVSTRPIPAGEEITFNYGFDLVDYKQYPCQCGTADCVGYMVAEEFFPHLRSQPQPGPTSEAGNDESRAQD